MINNKDVIIRLRKNNPFMSMASIGREVGKSREWVRIVLVNAGLATKAENRVYTCIVCGKNRNRANLAYCSKNCQYPHGRTIFECAYCGKEKSIYSSSYKIRIKNNKKQYCSRVCRDNGRRKVAQGAMG